MTNKGFGRVIRTEYAQFEGSEILDTLLPALNRSGGDLLVLSTPLGLNHYHRLWQMARASSEWWTATRTIADTVDHEGRPLIDPGLIARELAQGQRAEWLDQERGVPMPPSCNPKYIDLTGALHVVNDPNPPQPIPEPATLLLFGTTAAGLGLARWYRRRERAHAA